MTLLLDYTLDFETEKIVDGSPTPPKPVGMALKRGSDPGIYYAFGHPTGNNTNWGYVAIALEKLVKNGNTLIFHNAHFDVGVMDYWFKVKPGDTRIRDTMLEAFLVNPNSDALGLKPLSELLLDMPPDEQSTLRDWIVGNVKGATLKNWGEHIAKAPGDIVAPYAIGDVDRTKALHDLLYPQVLLDNESIRSTHDNDHKKTLLDAYATEVALINVVRKMEMVGVKLSPMLPAHAEHWHAEYEKTNTELRGYVGPDITLGGKLMFELLATKGLLDKRLLTYTEKGNPKFGREFLNDLVTDERLRQLLTRRSKLTKHLGTYIDPWLESFNLNHGRLHPYFMTTRSEGHRGTRTGRFSSNLQQIPKKAEEGFPNLRSFILPDDDEVLIVRDFSAQEIRVAAHFSEGTLMEEYRKNPDLDVHGLVQELIQKAVGYSLERRVSKTITFLKLYGGGPKKLIEQIHCTLDEARGFFEAYDAALPEFKRLNSTIERMVKKGIKIRTWGGRTYDVEPPFILPSGKHLEKYYKLPNTLIQGSSADMTKHAMLRYDSHPDRNGRLMLTVHDELVVSVDYKHLSTEMAILKWAMEEQQHWDVPIRSSGEAGYNYGTLETYAEKVYDQHELAS